MQRDARAAHLVEHVRALSRERQTINGFLKDDEYPSGMGNATAEAEGWPFRSDSELVFVRPDLNLLREAWFAHATTSPVSSRALFEIKALKHVFRRITIVERVFVEQRLRYRVKYQGSYLAALMGNNLDKFIDENIPPQLLPRWHTVFDSVLDSGLPIRLVIDFEFAKLNFASAEAFIAPLSNGTGKTDLVLAGIYFRPRDTGAADQESADD